MEVCCLLSKMGGSGIEHFTFSIISHRLRDKPVTMMHLGLWWVQHCWFF